MVGPCPCLEIEFSYPQISQTLIVPECRVRGGGDSDRVVPGSRCGVKGVWSRDLRSGRSGGHVIQRSGHVTSIHVTTKKP